MTAISRMKAKRLYRAVCVCAVAAFSAAASYAEGLPTPAQTAKKIAEQFLSADPADYHPRGYKGGKAYGGKWQIHYATVSLWVNALECARLSQDSELEERLVKAFEPFLAERAKVLDIERHVDFSIVGAIPLEIACNAKDGKLRAAMLELGLKYADRQWEEPKEGCKWGDKWYDPIPLDERLDWWEQGYSPETRLWIDDMYMITVLQSLAYRATGDYKYIERAGREMCLYLDRLQREDGLFNHAPGAPFAWGRGNGWMAAGMALNLKYLKKDDPSRAKILAGYNKMMATLLLTQRASGLWGQIVDDAESWDETSCSAMFAYALQEGLNQGLLKQFSIDIPNKIRAAYSALVAKMDEYGNIADVCAGTGWRNDRNHYMKRPRVNGDPHGQAPMLWLCGAMMEGETGKK